MTQLVDRIAQDARRLSPSEREWLIADLAQSLTDEPLTEVEQAWVEVAERRMDELISGKVQGIPAKVVFESIRSEMGWST